MVLQSLSSVHIAPPQSHVSLVWSALAALTRSIH